MRTLHMELTLTTALAFGLMCFCPASAAELELKPAFDNPGVKVAAITFLPDWFESTQADNIDMDINIDSKWCEKQGYSYGCPPQQTPYEICERDNNYVKCSKTMWCKDNGYTISSCSLPKYPDKQCPNGEKLYKECVVNNQQACKDVGYVNTCPSGQKLYNTTNRCSWDNSFGKCCTPSGCPAYTSLGGSYGSSGANDGCGYACYYTCSINCPPGTTEANTGGCGGSTKNGCGNKTCYYPYQSCCSYSTTEAYCSSQCKYTSGTPCVINGGTYYPGCGSSKCSSGYVCQNGACVCSPEYQYKCWGTGHNGGSGDSCDSKYKSCNCSTGYTWNGNSCAAQPSGWCCNDGSTSYTYSSDAWATCKRNYGYVDCRIMQDTCRALGKTPRSIGGTADRDGNFIYVNSGCQ